MVIDLTCDVGPLCGYTFCLRRKRRRAELNGQERTHERTDRRADERMGRCTNGRLPTKETRTNGLISERTNLFDTRTKRSDRYLACTLETRLTATKTAEAANTS